MKPSSTFTGKRYRRNLKNIRVANANAYADHLTSKRLDVPLVAGKVVIYGEWYMYFRYPQEFVRRVAPRKAGKVLRMLARNRLVRDLWVKGHYFK